MGLPGRTALAVALLAGPLLGLAAQAVDRELSRIARGTSAPRAPRVEQSRPGQPSVRGARRAVILSVAAVEIAFAMGEGRRVVGVGEHTEFPEPARALPRVGGPMSIDYERISALRPDLIAAQSSKEDLERFARARGIPFLRLTIETSRDVWAACRALGSAFGVPAAGERLAERIALEMEGVRALTAGLPEVPCYASVYRMAGALGTLTSAGRDTFVDEMIELGGGRNVFRDLAQRYPTVSKEALVLRSPEVVLELAPGLEGEDSARRLAADWDGLPSLPAVQKGRISVIDHGAALVPGPRMAEVALEIAAALHPEVRTRLDRMTSPSKGGQW